MARGMIFKYLPKITFKQNHVRLLKNNWCTDEKKIFYISMFIYNVYV